MDRSAGNKEIIPGRKRNYKSRECSRSPVFLFPSFASSKESLRIQQPNSSSSVGFVTAAVRPPRPPELASVFIVLFWQLGQTEDEPSYGLLCGHQQRVDVLKTLKL